jgi:Pyruvate/2-oxoacid:ferredoxin oxidoreductase delta subunit
MSKRKIIEIDEDKCTGCGQCIISCAEGALAIVDGKAKLVKDVYCDGLGACLGECPEGALTIIERDAADFNEHEAMERVRALKEAESKKKAAQEAASCGCPGAQAMQFKKKERAAGVAPAGKVESALEQWPLKLQLLGPGAPFLHEADLLLLADCAGTALPDVHAKLLPGKAVAMGCPKLDDLEAHIERLAGILKFSGVKSVTVARMEVPCCRGFVYAAQEAASRAGVNIPITETVVGRTGEIISEQRIA